MHWNCRVLAFGVLLGVRLVLLGFKPTRHPFLRHAIPAAAIAGTLKEVFLVAASIADSREPVRGKKFPFGHLRFKDLFQRMPLLVMVLR